MDQQQKSKGETSDSETSYSGTSENTITTIVFHSGAHALSWSGAHLRPKINLPSHEDAPKRCSKIQEAKFAGAREEEKTPEDQVKSSD